MDGVTQQETTEVFLRDGRPLQPSRIQGHIGEGDVLRAADRSFEEQNISNRTSILAKFIPTKLKRQAVKKKVDTGRLTSFGEVEPRGPVGALAVVDALHVASVLVRSSVQGEAVSRERLQGLCVLRKAGS